MTHALLINPTAMEAGLLAAGSARAQTGLRASALERFAKSGLPHRRTEAWKWTDLRAALRDPLPFAAAANDVIAPSIFCNARPFEINIMNGRAAWREAAPNGVAVNRASPDAPLPSLCADHPTASLALAFADERVEIAIRGAVAQPIHLRRITGACAAHSRVSLTLADGAAATLIESFAGTEDYFSNSTTEITLGDGARLTRLVLQDGSDAGVETSLCTASLGGHARFDQSALLLGAKLSRIETRISCRGAGAHASLASASALSGARHADFTSLVSHHAIGCTTRQQHKAALKDRSHGVFQGKFLVARGAQKTDAQMRAGALLLSSGAEADHKPELEIYADDVQCSHGAAAGALDEDALFYMKSRGLGDAAARSLLIEAFLSDALSAIDHVGLEEAFRARLDRWLGSGS